MAGRTDGQSHERRGALARAPRLSTPTPPKRRRADRYFGRPVKVTPTVWLVPEVST